MEYECEVKGLLTPEEFQALGKPPTQFPKGTSRGKNKTKDDVTPCQEDDRWGVYVALSNGAVFGCDLVVSATGVTPSARELVVQGGAPFDLAEDGGLKVDRQMRTNLPHVYAAGDVCAIQWEHHSNLWFQVSKADTVGHLNRLRPAILSFRLVLEVLKM